jgi:hypothetical protein
LKKCNYNILKKKISQVFYEDCELPMLRTALMISGLCSHFFNRPTLVLGFNQLFHQQEMYFIGRSSCCREYFFLCGCGGQKFGVGRLLEKKGEKGCQRLSGWFLGPITAVLTK